jgi:hypothetical protein
MLDIDWRSAEGYQHANLIPAAGFAWEYLRRDEDYHRAFDSMKRDELPTAVTLDTFSRRWGLRFPAGSAETG